MTSASSYAALNELLINLGRSLLQYVGECWPWTSQDSSAAQEKVTELVQQQKQQARALAELLHEAEWPVDFGTYPTEYTDLHYVALDYLLNQLIQNQLAVMEDAKSTLPLCEDHSTAKQLVGEILAMQQSISHELKTLASPGENSPVA